MSDEAPVASTTADNTPISTAGADPNDDHDPDGDPAMLDSDADTQPDPAEGSDDSGETGRPESDGGTGGRA